MVARAGKTNKRDSEYTLSRRMQMALSGLSTAERTQRVSDFVAWRAHFITATPATFFSLEQASSREVYRTLEEQVKGLAADWANPTQVHEKLKALTQMPDLTGELGRLYASQQLQKLRELKAETARQMQALGGDAGSEGMTVAQVDQLSMQLERKLCKPANIDKYLHAVQEHQGEGRRSEAPRGAECRWQLYTHNAHNGMLHSGQPWHSASQDGPPACLPPGVLAHPLLDPSTPSAVCRPAGGGHSQRGVRPAAGRPTAVEGPACGGVQR